MCASRSSSDREGAHREADLLEHRWQAGAIAHDDLVDIDGALGGPLRQVGILALFKLRGLLALLHPTQRHAHSTPPLLAISTTSTNHPAESAQSPTQGWEDAPQQTVLGKHARMCSTHAHRRGKTGHRQVPVSMRHNRAQHSRVLHEGVVTASLAWQAQQQGEPARRGTQRCARPS